MHKERPVPPAGTLYGVPKNNIAPEQYAGLKTFAFEFGRYIYFTDATTAAAFSEKVLEWRPVQIEKS